MSNLDHAKDLLARGDAPLAVEHLLYLEHRGANGYDLNYVLGTAYLQANEFRPAAQRFKKALEIKTTTSGLNGLAFAFFKLSAFAEATYFWSHAHDRSPDDPEITINLSTALRLNGEPEKAFRLLTSVPNQERNANFWQEFGETSRATGDTVTAETAYKNLLEYPNSRRTAIDGLCESYRESGRLKEAILLRKQCCEKEPFDEENWNNLATAHWAADENERAITAYAVALALNSKTPMISSNLAHSLLKRECFIEGFVCYEMRRQREQVGCCHISGLYQGQNGLPEPLRIRTEQGDGDIIQFSRYLKPFFDQGIEVILETHDRLHKLLEMLNGSQSLLTLEPISNEKVMDGSPVYSLLSLPLYFFKSQGFLNAHPYLTVSSQKKRYWASRVDISKPLIGVCFSSSGRGPKGRSCPKEIFERLFDISDANFIVLQKDAENFPDKSSVVHLNEPIDKDASYIDTAAISSLCDLVITVDTSIPHLTGALGVPTWLLLPKVADWRWFSDNKSSQWYPRTKIFRQNIFHDWDHLIKRVQDELAIFVNTVKRYN